MGRFLFWGLIWVLCLGFLRIEVTYRDGLHILLKSLWLKEKV